MVDKLGAFQVPPAGGTVGLKESKNLGEASSAGASFSALIEQFGADTLNATRQSEKQSLQAVSKKADIVDVVTAVANAELTLETVMSLRDRMIAAYKEIIKTPI